MRAGFQFPRGSMTFRVTYRAKDGALREERIEAAGRSECIAECRRRGISPTKITEGGKGRDGAQPSRSDATGDSKRTTAKWMAVAVLIATVAGGAWWWFGGRGATALPAEVPVKPKAEKPKDERPVKPPRPKTRPSAGTNAAARAVASPPLTAEQYLGKNIVSRQVVTNATGSTYEIVRTDDGKSHRVNVKHPGKGRRLFKYNSDILLAQLLDPAGKGDSPPIPIDGDLDKQFEQSLLEPIVFEDADTEEDRKLKETVILAREDVKQLVKTGATFTEIIREHQTLAAENSELRRKIAIEAKRIRETSGAEEAKEYVAKMNEALERMGAAPLRRTTPNPRRPQQSQQTQDENVTNEK